MLVAQISDMHFCMDFLKEVTRCVDYAISEFIARKPDIAVISGDSTDRRLDLHSPATAEMLRQVRRLADQCPTLILHGTRSHEPPGTLEVFKTLGGRHPVYVADQIKQVSLVNGQWIESDDWTFSDIPAGATALFSVLPSVNKGAVAAIEGADKAAEATGEYVSSLLTGWAPINQQAREAGIPTLGVSHGTVSGCTTEHGVPMVGLDFEFTTGSLFAAECSAFLLGHIHKFQVFRKDSQLIAYPGSPGRLHYGEKDPKGVLVWDVDATGASVDFIETPAKRLVEIDFDGPPDMQKLREAAKDAAGAYVRIRWNIDAEHRHSVDKDVITALFADASDLKTEGHINPVLRSRTEGINKAVSLQAKLGTWCEVTETKPDPLTERLTMLESMEEDDIVSEITEPKTTKEKAA